MHCDLSKFFVSPENNMSLSSACKCDDFRETSMSSSNTASQCQTWKSIIKIKYCSTYCNNNSVGMHWYWVQYDEPHSEAIFGNFTNYSFAIFGNCYALPDFSFQFLQFINFAKNGNFSAIFVFSNFSPRVYQPPFLFALVHIFSRWLKAEIH